MPTAAQVIAKGRSQLGYIESPHDSNNTKYGAWYGMNGQSWCAMFQSWVLHQAGVHNFAIETAKGFAWTVAGVHWFKARGLWVSSARAVPGDLIFYDWGANGVADHVGMLLANGQSSMQVLEGNTGDSSANNGGQVLIRTRDHTATTLGAGRMTHFYGGATATAPAPRASWQSDNGSYGHPLVRLGAKGEVVNHLQGKLLRHGQNIVTDSNFGPVTQAAVKRFQAYYRLSADGVVGPMTWAALHR